MIEDKRIVSDIDIAIESLNAIKYCFLRDGFVSERYVSEKAGNAESVVRFLLALAKGKGEKNDKDRK